MLLQLFAAAAICNCIFQSLLQRLQTTLFAISAAVGYSLTGVKAAIANSIVSEKD